MGAVNQTFQGSFPITLSLAVQNKLVSYIYTLDTCLTPRICGLVMLVLQATDIVACMYTVFILIKFILDKIQAQTSLKYLYIVYIYTDVSHE